MDKNKIFDAVQKRLESPPLMLIGTGATIPLGIPGMKILSEHLISRLDDNYKADSTWDTIVEKLNSGVDLESALTDIVLLDDLRNAIVLETWKLIANADIKVFNDHILGNNPLALASLIHKFHENHPQVVNIITTNYDRVIEYACDQQGIRCDTRYQGGYIRYPSPDPPQPRNVVNLFKVHGSLDWFKDSNGIVYSIPGLYYNPLTNFVPEIISPGASKHEAILTGSCHNILHEADTAIWRSKSFLCMGYGFNDGQIQSQILSKIQTGTPIVVATKSLSDEAIRLIINRSANHAIIVEDPDREDSTLFIINKNCQALDGKFWSIDGLLSILS